MYLNVNCPKRQLLYPNPIKRLTNPGLGFQRMRTAWWTIRGYEAMNMIRKGQIQDVEKGAIRTQIEFVERLFGLVA